MDLDLKRMVAELQAEHDALEDVEFELKKLEAAKACLMDKRNSARAKVREMEADLRAYFQPVKPGEVVYEG
jgi:chromosome segregation ATPase